MCGEASPKSWSKAGQMLVKRWSKGGHFGGFFGFFGKKRIIALPLDNFPSLSIL
jgi:hypothetical protein